MLWRVIVAGACAAVLVSGCGGSSHPSTVAQTVTAAAPTTTSASTAPTATTTTPTTSTPTTTQTSSNGDGATDLRPSHALHEPSFQSPSGNIGCMLASSVARCDIRSRRWSPPSRPRSCPLDYGQGLEVTGSGPGHLVCAGDTALDPSAPRLAYGAAASAGPYLCTSATVGMTCVNQVTRHGFFLSAQRYRAF